jgi:protein-L-isoaspartate(D-aspartate) O-methyltransferase
MVHDQIEARGIRDPELIRALLTVPRHRFLDDPATIRDAYADRALAIGSGQTISQPYVVAAMTDAARPTRGWRGAHVLEVGTGSGYQAAILAELGADVTSIERHAELARQAKDRLRAAGYGERVRIVVGDGTRGLPESAPFDAILVTAGGPEIPSPLVEQLHPGGARLVMPVGDRDTQTLTLVERHGPEITTRETERVVFVPLIGEHGFDD